jgi:hypothetical protein
MRLARHLIGSPVGMVQQLVTLVAKGYRYYFVGRMKADAEPEAFDRRLRDYYDADLPKWTRERRRSRGEATARYLRHDDWFIVLVTEGTAERFWREDKHRARDVRSVPIRFRGYSISFRPGGYRRVSSEERVWRQAMWRAYREARAQGEQGHAPPPAARDMKWHVHVRMDDETYAGVKAYFLNIALHRRAEFLASEFGTLGFEPYGPIRTQLRNILRAVNEARRMANYDALPLSVIRFERRIVKAFVEPSQDVSTMVPVRG